jgi:hypothetical protein
MKKFRSRDTAIKKEVARFVGPHYTSERDSASGDLVIHSHHDEFGQPASVEGAAHDHAAPTTIKSLADLNRVWSTRGQDAHTRKA